MKTLFPLIGLTTLGACCVVFASITQKPDTAAAVWITQEAAPTLKAATLSTLKSTPFLNLLHWESVFSPTCTGKAAELPTEGGMSAPPVLVADDYETALEVRSMRSAGYTLAECCKVFGASTDTECEAIERAYYAE